MPIFGISASVKDGQYSLGIGLIWCGWGPWAAPAMKLGWLLIIKTPCGGGWAMRLHWIDGSSLPNPQSWPLQVKRSLTHCLVFLQGHFQGYRWTSLFPTLHDDLTGKISSSLEAPSSPTNSSIVLCNVTASLRFHHHPPRPHQNSGNGGPWRFPRALSPAQSAQVHVLPVLPELHYPCLEDTSLVILLIRSFSDHFLHPSTTHNAQNLDLNAFQHKFRSCSSGKIVLTC